jgi:hypothetical protein
MPLPGRRISGATRQSIVCSSQKIGRAVDAWVTRAQDDGRNVN